MSEGDRATSPRPQAVARISVMELNQRLGRGEPLVVLDVREDEERAFSAIPLPQTVTNLHVPMGLIPAQLQSLRDQVGASPLVVYCHHGQRSMTVASWLQRQGFTDVINLEGGIDAWSLNVDPHVRRY